MTPGTDTTMPFPLPAILPLPPADLRESSPFAAVHLQWFAPEDEGRTEQPTEHKLRKAREEGKVAKTAELAGALVLLFPALAVAALSSYLMRGMVEMVRFYFQYARSPAAVPNGQLFAAFGSYFFRLTWPVFVTAFVAALFGTLVQVGFLFTTKPITPDFSRIVPRFGRFFSRSFFSVEAMFNLAKSLFKVTVIGVLAYVNIMMEIERLANLTRVSYLASAGLIAAITFRLLVESAVVFFVLSLFDYLFQRWIHRRSLMMSRQEIKEERKMYEGDPLVRNRLRERMREIMTRNLAQLVPRADVVITNPTHFAVVLEWKESKMAAPMMTAKGQDHAAARIKELAREHGVPVVENKPLARALYAELEIGDTIPERYYSIVAAVLAEVYRMNGRTADVV